MGKTNRNEKAAKPEDLANGNWRPFAYLHEDPSDPTYDVSFTREDEWGDELRENALVEAPSRRYAMLEVIRTFPDAVDFDLGEQCTFIEWWSEMKFMICDTEEDESHLSWKMATEKITLLTRKD
jgi:hypothetical protein